MATTFSITGVKNVANGYEAKYTINGDASRGIVFASAAAFSQWVDDHPLTEEDVLALAFRVWKAKDPGLNIANIVGKTLTINLNAATNIVTLT
jgi:hypothetical protein